MKRALGSYMLNNSDFFDILRIRGFFKKHFWKNIFFKIIILSLSGVISGFLVLYFFIRIRLNYLEDIYLQDSVLSFNLDINYKLFQVFFVVIVLTIILVIINTLSLRLTNKMSSLNLNKDDMSPSIKNLLIYGLVLFYLIIVIKDVELLLLRSYEPFFILIIMSCSILFGLIAFKFVIDFIGLIVASNVNDYTQTGGKLFLFLINTWNYIKLVFIEVLLPILLFFFLFLYYERNLSSSYFIFILFLIILYLVILLKLTLFSDKILFRKVLKFLNSSHLIHQRRKLLSLVLIFNLFIFWQGTLYFSMTEASLDEAYYVVGSDIRISTYASQVSTIGLDGKDNERILRSDNRIESVLRIYINNKHVIQPKDDDIVDLILFNASQYIDHGYFYREDWFKHDFQSVAELFSTLHNNPNSTIILDSKMAGSIGKDIGDKILITPYPGSGDSQYFLTIIGLVDYFILEHTINQEENDYNPFAILDLGITSPNFQTPRPILPPIPQIEKNPTTFWLVKTPPNVNRIEIKQTILRDTSISALRGDGSFTIDEIIKNSFFSNNFSVIRHFLGAGLILEIGLFLLFAYYELNTRKKSIENKDISQLVDIDLFPNDNLVQVNYLSQMLAISYGFVTSIILGSLLVTLSIRVISPYFPLPIILKYESLIFLLVFLYVLLLLLVYVINKGKLRNNEQSNNKKVYYELFFFFMLIIFIFVFGFETEFFFFIVNYPPDLFILILIFIFLINFIIMYKFDFKSLLNLNFILKPFEKISTYYSKLKSFLFSRKNFLYMITIIIIISFLGGFLLIFIPILGLLPVIFLISVIISFLLLIKYYKFGTSMINFYLIWGKKFFQNKKRIPILFSGMVLALSLIAGISINIDTTSAEVIEDYFDGSNRVSDLHLNLGWNKLEPLIDYFGTESQQNEFPWINDYSSGFSWFAVGFSQNQIPLWEGNPDYIPDTSIVPILSVDPNFKEFFNNSINMIEGTFDLTDNQVVITPKFARIFLNINNPSDAIGEEFSLFEWLASTVSLPNLFPSLKNINWTSPKLRVSGIISESSPYLEYTENFGYSNQFIKYLGVVFVEKAVDTFPSFWYQLNRIIVQNYACPDCPVFEPFVTLNVEKSFIDTLNPNSFYDQINNFINYIPRIYENIQPFNDDSQLKLVLDDYLYWVTTARVALILLSSPIIFLGWYIADFSFKHIYFERKKEISTLKSRGIHTSHIWGSLILENFIIWIISICLGFLLGIISLSTLSSIFLDQQPSFKISFYTPAILVLFGTILIIFGSFRPIKEIINNPVDELLQEEDAIKSSTSYNQEKSEFSRLRNSFFVVIIGIFLILNINNFSSDIQRTNIVAIISLTAIIMTVIGSIMFTAILSRSIPALIEKIFYGLNSYKLYLVTRELKRHGSKTVAIFIVFSLTIAFIVTSQILFDSTNTYYSNDVYFQVGADLQLKTGESYEHIIDDKYFIIENKLLSNDGVESVSPFYIRNGYFLDDQNDPKFPSVTEYALRLRWQLNTQIPIMFFNISTYFQTVYLENNFLVEDSIENVKQKMLFAYQDYLSDPYQFKLPVIIDEISALEMNLKVNDTVYFTSSRVRVMKGTGIVVAIAKRMPPNLVNRFIISPFAFDMKRAFNANYPTSGFLVKTTTKSASNTVLNNVTSNYEYWPINDGLTLNDVFSQERIGKELSAIKNALLISLFYSLVISSLGFIIVLSARISQRSRDFGIIKALGVSNSGISLIIILETSVSIFSALFLGIFIGLTSGYLLNLLLPTLSVDRVFIINIPIILIELFFALIFSYIGAIFASYLATRNKILDLI